MNLDTRDQLDTHLDDAKQALRKARAALVRSGMTVANDWTILGAIGHASAGVDVAIEALPTVHSLQAQSSCLACTEGVGRHAIDCPKAVRGTDLPA